jgi:short-subunit dehydrogenase
MDLKNKTVLVTGATGGIGRELCERLDKEGANLILISKTESELKNLLILLKGKNHKYFSCDLSSIEDCVKVSGEIAERFKTIDVFVAAAGVGIYKPIEDLSLKEFQDSLNVNLTSNFIFIKTLEPLLNNSETPLVLAIGSGMGVIPAPGRSAYTTSKFALRGFILSLNEEFKRTKINFCLITLGSTLTSFGPMSLQNKKLDALSGKAYFSVEWVGKKLTQIMMDDARDSEYTFYPSDYGFGS